MSKEVTTRGDDGRFLPGVSGNPNGRPKGKKNQITDLKQDLEIALRKHVDPEQIKNIINKMVEVAANGNVGAAKLILDKVLSNARETDDVQDAAGGWTFVIKNVTVQHEAKPDHDDVVDGEFTDVTTEEQ